MKKINLTTLLILLCSFALAQSRYGTVTLDIKGWEEDTVYVLKNIFGSGEEVLDTLKSIDGRVVFRSECLVPQSLIFVSAKSVIPRSGGKFMIPDASIVRTVVFPDVDEKIEGELYPHRLIYNSNGSGLDYHKESAEEHRRFIDISMKVDSLNTLIECSREHKLSKEEEDKVFFQRSEYYSQRRILRKESIIANPQSQLSGLNLCYMNYQNTIDLESTLTKEVRNGLFKVLIDAQVSYAKKYFAHLENKKRIKEGNAAPDFELKDDSGIVRKLSDFTGRWVVLDFWGTWCGWCITGLPDMRSTYLKHKNKMEIISIACNDKEDKWKAFIAENSMPWTQLINDENRDVSVLYGIDRFPTKIIVDPKGVICGIFNGETSDFYHKIGELIR